jgi:hypothetical protein
MKNIITKLSHTVEDRTVYYFTIKVGEAQIGYSSFKDFEGKYVSGNIILYPLGKGEKIRGKKLISSSMVTDVNPNTNLTSITYRLNDEDIKTISEEVESNNSVIYYTTYLTFK